MTIKDMAIRYQEATPEKHCDICYMAENHMANGLTCMKWDLPTSRNGRCGEFIEKRKPEKVEPVDQAELF